MKSPTLPPEVDALLLQAAHCESDLERKLAVSLLLRILPLVYAERDELRGRHFLRLVKDAQQERN